MTKLHCRVSLPSQLEVVLHVNPETSCFGLCPSLMRTLGLGPSLMLLLGGGAVLEVGRRVVADGLSLRAPSVRPQRVKGTGDTAVFSRNGTLQGDGRGSETDAVQGSGRLRGSWGSRASAPPTPASSHLQLLCPQPGSEVSRLCHPEHHTATSRSRDRKCCWGLGAGLGWGPGQGVVGRAGAGRGKGARGRSPASPLRWVLLCPELQAPASL